MINIKMAVQIAEKYISRDEGHNLVLMHGHTMEFELGWVFFYQTKEYVETGDIRQMVGGNAPIIINKMDGCLHVTGTELPVEKYIREYRKSLE